jgi:AraC-like DNA-binding protein
VKLSAAGFMQLLVVVQSGFFSAYLWTRRRGTAARALGSLLALLAVHLATEMLQDLGLLAEGVTLAQTFGLLYGPLFLAFVRALAGGECRWRGALHCLPWAAALLLWPAGALTPRGLGVAVEASLVVYLAAGWLSLRRYERELAATHSAVPAGVLPWVRFAICGLAVVAALDLVSFVGGWIGGGPGGDLVPILLFAALFLYVDGFVLAALETPALFPGVSAEERHALDVTGEAEAVSAEDLLRLERFMEEERPYLRPDLTLLDVARQAGLPPRRLSALVNRGKGRNFSGWVNSYRVEAAKRRLADPAAGENLLELLQDAGFSSKSTFNAVFKRQTGLAPSEYRRRARAAEGRTSENTIPGDGEPPRA